MSCCALGALYVIPLHIEVPCLLISLIADDGNIFAQALKKGHYNLLHGMFKHSHGCLQHCNYLKTLSERKAREKNDKVAADKLFGGIG